MESLFNKNAGLKAYSLIEKRLQRRCFPVKFVKYLGTPFLILPVAAAVYRNGILA